MFAVGLAAFVAGSAAFVDDLVVFEDVSAGFEDAWVAFVAESAVFVVVGQLLGGHDLDMDMIDLDELFYLNHRFDPAGQ